MKSILADHPPIPTDHNTFVYAGFSESDFKILQNLRRELYKVLGKEAPHWHLHITLTANIYRKTHYNDLDELKNVVRTAVGSQRAVTLIPSEELETNGGASITFENQVDPFTIIHKNIHDKLGNEYTTDGWHVSVIYDEKITAAQAQLLKDKYRQMRPKSLRCNHYGVMKPYPPKTHFSEWTPLARFEQEDQIST
jgi:hypothetical protein